MMTWLTVSRVSYRSANILVEFSRTVHLEHICRFHTTGVLNTRLDMKEVARLSTADLSVEERNLLSVAYKNVIGSRRASLRIITSIEQKETAKKNEHQATMVGDYRRTVEKELGEICRDVLAVLDKDLVPNAQTGEGKVFYFKM